MSDTDGQHHTKIAAKATATWDALPRGASLGRYIVLNLLGSGGMGVVYAAYDPDLDRKIAIKLLRSDRVAGDVVSDGETRLMREARALARLTHPNVLPVFDVGRFDGQLFIAMEFVEGQTMHEWQKDGAVKWPEVLARYMEAGRGLAAAHGVDVVHRDFKPQNIMIGTDDRVRVMDFGLAREAGEADSAKDGKPLPSADLLSSPLTQIGSVLGTPGYMSPEQLKDKAVGTASDQFSFAVSLYEALYGERPYVADNHDELLATIENGTVSPPPPGSLVPGWLRRILLRALSANPDDRYQDIEAMLTALGRDPSRIRNRWFGGVAATLSAVAIGITIYSYQQQPIELCQDAGRKLAGIWDDSRKEAVQTAFMTTGVAYAASTWRTVQHLLDEYSATWTDTHTEACKATWVHGEQSEQLLDLRMSCLENRRQEIRALTDLFAVAKVDTMEKAAKAAGLLSPISACSNSAALLARVALPGDPQQRKVVSAIENDLAHAKALHEIGQYGESVDIAKTALQKAAATGHAPTMAHASFRVGDGLDYLGDSKQAKSFLQNAVFLGAEGGDDRRAAAAAAALVWVVGYILDRPEEAAVWSRIGRSFINRMGGDARIEADLLSNEGTVAQRNGDYRTALTRAERVLMLRREVFGNNHERVASAIVNLANAKRYVTAQESAVDLYREAYEIFAETVGDDYPLNTVTLYNWGGVLQEIGRAEQAHPILLKAVQLGKRSFGINHIHTAIAISNLAAAEFALGRYEESLSSYHLALSSIENSLGSDHPHAAPQLAGIADNLIAMNQFDEALPYIERGLSLTAENSAQKQPHSMLRLAEAEIAIKRDRNRDRARGKGEQALKLAIEAGPIAVAQKQAAETFLTRLQKEQSAP